MKLSRRHFLGAAAAAAVAPSLFPSRPTLAEAAPAITLRVERRVIEVLGRAAGAYAIRQPDGTLGLAARVGERFRVRLDNRAGEPTLIHWHGLIPPWQQDGVPGLSQPALAPGEHHEYDFPLPLAGSYWMHSHYELQEQQSLAAPLIVREPAEASADLQDVVVMLHDFSFRDPAEILAGLGRANERAAGSTGSGGHGMGHGAPQPSPGGHGAAAPAVHLHDVEYDAFLADDRTLDDPAVHRVEVGGRVRLRLINAAAATNFWIDLEALSGRLVAVDGVPVEPTEGGRFEFAIAQRLDILLELPREEGAWPVFAVREGDSLRTGFVLATKNGRIARLDGRTEHPAAPVALGLERRLRSRRPLTPRPADRRHVVTITEMPGYVWMLNGAVHGQHAPLQVRDGERVEIEFVDRTSMAHPMHLHGHHFQVVAIDGTPFQGAVRDTVLVPAGGRVTIAFDAANPGRWALHCHHLYHMAGGMMTTVEYES